MKTIIDIGWKKVAITNKKETHDTSNSTKDEGNSGTTTQEKSDLSIPYAGIKEKPILLFTAIVCYIVVSAIRHIKNKV